MVIFLTHAKESVGYTAFSEIGFNCQLVFKHIFSFLNFSVVDETEIEINLWHEQ